MKRRRKKPATRERSWSDATWRMLAKRHGPLALVRFTARRELRKCLHPSTDAEKQAVRALAAITEKDVVGMLSSADAYHLRALLLRTIRAVHLLTKLAPTK